MTSNYWEETYAARPLGDLDRTDMSMIFDWIGLNFPATGVKIDWRRVPGKHAHWKIDDDEQLAAKASIEVCQRIRPGSIVEHVGDGLSPYGVRFSDDNAFAVVAALLEIPEHHYFVAEDRSWIVVVATGRPGRRRSGSFGKGLAVTLTCPLIASRKHWFRKRRGQMMALFSIGGDLHFGDGRKA